ncbi:PAS domain S-box-containing protein/diguanylate cyclase (GGDEF) domain-containing protein [Noviherbaspirillum humi]|uniref:PAS domain S-box-containing protein/diguanylate cyclase (GGDEF) domain-containing protein n=1 Tax=Noviherbaspirillum humi TaxID=1688639 RepID=A0A239C634_9BURK|nr:bifunctional diguanylate cyclase/phosphodiesterase [Noviherbaspirillum humi]SNS15352.1 PAS domain S-box-containing protein/diguanylate cyclase (GGDEF) domain-containing protein [Noviherbaspirillum humi]
MLNPSASFPATPEEVAAHSRLMAECVQLYASIQLDAGGRISRWSRQAAAMTGYDAAQAVGRMPAFLLANAADADRLASLMQAAALGKQALELDCRRSDGDIMPTHFLLEAALDHDAMPDGFSLSLLDLRQRWRLEEQLLQHWQQARQTRVAAERRRFQSVLDQMPSGVFIIEADSGRLVYQNAEVARLLGGEPKLAAAEADGAGAIDDQGRMMPVARLPVMRALRLGEVLHAEEIAYRRPDGRMAVLAVSAAPIRDEQGRITHAVSVLHDVQPLKEMQASLTVEKEKAQVTLQVLTDSVIIVDTGGRVEYLNPAAEHLTGHVLAQARGQALSAVLDFEGMDAAQAETGIVARCLHDGDTPALFQHGTLRSATGRSYAVDAAVAPIHLSDGRLVGAVLVLHDVTESRRLLRTLAHQASHDALTGLLNRREFEVRLQRALERARGGRGNSALLYFDLDQFKVVNDTCGHAAGDELLRQLAQTYQSVIRERDTLARLGGDEFALIVEHCGIEDAVCVANKMLDTTTNFKFNFGGRTFSVGASIGVVPVNASAISLEQTLRRADHACYIAKENGRNRVFVHQDNDADTIRRQSDMHWVARINEALRTDQLELFYQTIAPVDDRHELLHYEILLRLKDTDGRHIGPGAFLPAAERYDLMPAVDRWVLKRVLAWLESQPEHVRQLDMCTINLSRRTLADESFQQFALQCLEASPVPPHKLCFEITENGAIDNPNRTIRFIESLKELGCRFSLDDFGTGMTSFSYLKMLPVDFIKIDGSFVTMMKESPIDREMIRFTNEISHIMGRQTIAEFVGDEDTLEDLRDLHIDYAQGFWIGRPKPLQGMSL